MKKLPEFVSESEVREMWRAVDTEDAGVIDLHQFGRMVVPSQVRHAKAAQSSQPTPGLFQLLVQCLQ